MPLLRSRVGAPMVTRAGGPLFNAPSNVAAAAIVRPSGALAFDMNQPGTRCRNWSGSNNQFENFGVPRDWAFNFSDAQNSFAGVRNQFTYLDVVGFTGQWEPAGGDVNRIRRKGATGQDSHTIVLECAPNPAAVPVGDKVVLWQVLGPGGYEPPTSWTLNGYNLPLKQKMTVTASTGSAMYDVNGIRYIELDAGQALPDFDLLPPKYDAGGFQRSTMHHRHWSFYKDTATKQLRHPLGWFTDLAINQVLANGGYYVSGGGQWYPSWADWSREFRLLGASLTTELWRLECEGLAQYFANTDPTKMAVELENEPVSEYHDVGDGPGYGDLLPDVWYGIARQVWGPDRTLIVKGTGFGNLNQMLTEFDFRCPTGDNAHLVHHSYDDQVRYPDGTIIRWTDIGQTDWMAQQTRAKINALGYKGGGMTEVGVDINRVTQNFDRGQRLGRLLTSYTNQDLYMFGWNMTGDVVRASDIYNIGGHRIEAYWPDIRPYASRAGVMTT